MWIPLTRWAIAPAILVAITLGTGTLCNAADVIETALRATVRVTANGKSGTGFFVTIPPVADNELTRTVLITAAHVVEEVPGAKVVLILRKADAEGGFVRHEHEITIKDGDRKLWVRHPDADIAVMGVTLPDGIDIHPFSLSQVAEVRHLEERVVRVGQDVVIPCFPAQVEANPAGWPVLRKGSVASHPLTPLARTPTIFVDYSHFGGDSGAPVVASVDGEPLVVGLVFAMLRQTDKTSAAFEERTTHMPLGLGISVQAPLIRQTIETWKAR